jgi:hypothetical protein
MHNNLAPRGWMRRLVVCLLRSEATNTTDSLPKTRHRSTRKENQTGCTQTLTAAQTTGGDSVCVTTAAQMVGVMLTLAKTTRRYFQTTSKWWHRCH